jgi:hypothetical protein
MFESQKRVWQFIAALLIISVGMSNLCLCSKLHESRSSTSSKSSPIKQCRCCGSQGKINCCCGVLDRCTRLRACCGNRNYPADYFAATDEQMRDKTDQLAKCMAIAIVFEVAIGQAGVEEETANLLQSTLTLRAQHICIQV